MNLSASEARERFLGSPIASLATASADGMPHLVPVTFAVAEDTIFFVIDHKPKRSMDLRRLRNIAQNSAVAVLVDHYNDDWAQLWWARADGDAEVWESGGNRTEAVHLLQSKYHQYVETPPSGPVVAIRIKTWTGWSFAG